MGPDVEKYDEAKTTDVAAPVKRSVSHNVTCANYCEASAYQIEIRRLKKVMVEAAAYVASEFHSDDIGEHCINRLNDNVVMKLKATAIGG